MQGGADKAVAWTNADGDIILTRATDDPNESSSEDAPAAKKVSFESIILSSPSPASRSSSRSPASRVSTPAAARGLTNFNAKVETPPSNLRRVRNVDDIITVAEDDEEDSEEMATVRSPVKGQGGSPRGRKPKAAKTPKKA
jgi:hypothetical protein